MNKQSNLYTLIYIIVIVTVVGALLAFTSMSLRSRQQANADADKMKQILMAVHVNTTDSDVAKKFDSLINTELLVDSEGEIITASQDKTGEVFHTDVAAEIRLPEAERRLPVYICRLADGETKFILPVYGGGLWGPIWGYVAINADGKTIYGAYFSHASETPGLGAKIAEPEFRDQFDNKTLFNDGVFHPVEVIKRGLYPSAGADYVDAVSGGTITSKGVGEMLDNCLTPYKTFLEKIQNRQ